MKVLLIMADADMHKYRYLGRVRSAREAPATMTTLTGLTRHDPSVEYTVIDESVQPVPLDARPDLVGISVMTGTARRCYALADHFRSHGLPVVLGGVHVTLLPQEARQHADCIVTGMADTTWPQLVADFKAGRMQAEYHEPEAARQAPFAPSIPAPRWDMVKRDGYMVPYVVQATRGCMHSCDFCAVPGIWPRFQRRPVADVVRDVASIPARRFVLNDVSPVDDVEYAKELFRALIPLKKTWGGLATSRVADDPELLDLMRRSGCQFLLIGFESVNQETLNKIYKRFNKDENYPELLYKLHQAGIIVQGTFVFGFDDDGPDVFARTVQRVQELKVDIPRYSIYTPYPGSKLFERLHHEGRILSYDWADYDTMHVVIRPARMTPVELAEGFRWAYRETFRVGNIFRRTFGGGLRFPIAFFGNLTYKLFVRRLYTRRGYELPVDGRASSQAAMQAQTPLRTGT